MVKAIRLHKAGGPKVLRFEEIEIGAPGPGEVRLRQGAIGLNFVDTYLRDGTGAYGDTGAANPLAYPAILGLEGAGVVEAVGPGVDAVALGDRVAYAALPFGAYAEQRVMPADVLVKLPSGVSEQIGAAVMLKGLTAEYLLRRCHPIKPGDTILIHAAAGGCGLLMGQWAAHIGATVIGTVSSPEKAALARSHGYHHVIDYSREDFVARVRELTKGTGVSVVYDSVGRTTFTRSLDCLARRGVMVLFGQASGPVDPVPLSALTDRGSLFLTRPGLLDYVATRAELVTAANALFDLIVRGILRVEIGQTFALKDAADAHIALEARRTYGSTLLIP
ncbi:MAG: quinone oxidoreductase [Alphaproteobacteria bacterium]|nr:quinone oxidoreductase [Alphaproteobacteria bacterium]